MLLPLGCQVLLGKGQRSLRLAATYELYEPLLLQVEEQGVLLLQDLAAPAARHQGRGQQGRQRSGLSVACGCMCAWPLLPLLSLLLLLLLLLYRLKLDAA